MEFRWPSNDELFLCFQPQLFSQIMASILNNLWSNGLFEINIYLIFVWNCVWDFIFELHCSLISIVSELINSMFEFVFKLNIVNRISLDTNHFGYLFRSTDMLTFTWTDNSRHHLFNFIENVFENFHKSILLIEKICIKNLSFFIKWRHMSYTVESWKLNVWPTNAFRIVDYR